MTSNPRVFVIGGGFAGLQAVRSIARYAPQARITLIDTNPYATMLPALPDVLSGRVPRQAVIRPYEEILDGRIERITDEVARVDLVAQTIHGRRGEHRYDYLVVTAGSKPEYYGFAAQGGTLHSPHSYAGAQELRDEFSRRAALNPRCSIVVVGAGYTGLEVAACLHHGARGGGATPQITVVEVADEILPFLKAGERQRIVAYLEALGITLRTSTSLVNYDGRTASLSDGTRIEEALVCWAAGMRAAGPEMAGELDRERDGRIQTSAFLQLPHHPRVFVAGDTAALQQDGRTVRRAVNFAYYSGRVAGRNVAASIANHALREFRPMDLGWVIPLGDISVGRIFGAIPVGGRPGLRLHYTMCGIRHFGASNAAQFYKTAVRLSRDPDPIVI